MHFFDDLLKACSRRNCSVKINEENQALRAKHSQLPIFFRGESSLDNLTTLQLMSLHKQELSPLLKPAMAY